MMIMLDLETVANCVCSMSRAIRAVTNGAALGRWSAAVCRLHHMFVFVFGALVRMIGVDSICCVVFLCKFPMNPGRYVLPRGRRAVCLSEGLAYGTGWAFDVTSHLIHKLHVKCWLAVGVGFVRLF